MPRSRISSTMACFATRVKSLNLSICTMERPIELAREGARRR